MTSAERLFPAMSCSQTLEGKHLNTFKKNLYPITTPKFLTHLAWGARGAQTLLLFQTSQPFPAWEANPHQLCWIDQPPRVPSDLHPQGHKILCWLLLQGLERGSAVGPEETRAPPVPAQAHRTFPCHVNTLWGNISGRRSFPRSCAAPARTQGGTCRE